jgi:hypothetical protein
MPNIYDPETWIDLPESVKVKLLTILSWMDGTSEEYENDQTEWEGDY